MLAERRGTQRFSDGFCCARVLVWKAWSNGIIGEVVSGVLQVNEVPDFMGLGVESYLLLIVIILSHTPTNFFQHGNFGRHFVSYFNWSRVCF